MNGQQLYALYAELQDAECNCMIDEWDELEICEQNTWNKLAAVLAV